MSRILLLAQPTDGGVFRHVSDLAAGLAARGHEVLLGAPLKSGVDVEFLPVPMGRAIRPAEDRRALASLVGILRRHRPDLVHAHSSKAGALARLARAAAPRLPVVYTPHGYSFASAFSARSCLVYRGMEAALASLASRVVCCCEFEGALARAVGPARRVRVVHNGVDVPERDLLREPKGSGIVSWTRLQPGKGLSTLLDALAAVRADHPEVTATLLGRGPQLADLQAQAVRLGVAGAVEFVTDPARWEPLFQQAAIVVHPSLAEAFPYTVLDAMAWGRPIVATDVGGVGEAVEDGRSGLLVPPGDAGALARAVRSLVADPTAAACLGVEARRRAESRFGVGRMVDGIADVYGEVLS